MIYITQEGDKTRYFKQEVVVKEDLDIFNRGYITVRGGIQLKCIGLIKEDLHESAKAFYETKASYDIMISSLSESIVEAFKSKGKIKMSEIRAMRKMKEDLIQEYESLAGLIEDSSSLGYEDIENIDEQEQEQEDKPLNRFE